MPHASYPGGPVSAIFRGALQYVIIVSYHMENAIMAPANPTAKTYAALKQAFNFFNDQLFKVSCQPAL